MFKKIIQGIIITVLSVSLFFAFGFNYETEYETSFEEGQGAAVMDEIVGMLEQINIKLTVFKAMLEDALSELDPLSEYVPALENAISICSSIIETLELKVTDLKSGLFVANEAIDEEIEVNWEKDGTQYEAEAELEYIVETENGVTEVSIEYEDEIEKESDDEDEEEFEEDEDDEDEDEDDEDEDEDDDDDEHEDDDEDENRGEEHEHDD